VVSQTNWFAVDAQSQNDHQEAFGKQVIKARDLEISSETGLSIVPFVNSNLSLLMYQDSNTELCWKQISFSPNQYLADSLKVIINWEVLTTDPSSN
jgi:hypothetical protein